MAKASNKGGVVGAGLDLLRKKEQTSALAEGVISQNNAIAVGVLGVYIALVGYDENIEKLFSELATEKRFLKFAVAMVLFNFTIDKVMPSDIKPIAKTFLWLGLALTASEDGAFNKITDYFKG